MPLISVLIPCHNAEKWLNAAIKSIRDQSHRELEILIYDDGSTDSTASIIQSAAKLDERIAPMSSPSNRGIVHALEAMLNVAKGSYIARMDADDISMPQRFQLQLQFMDRGGYALCGTWFREFGGGIPRDVRWHTSPEELRAAFLFQNTICHPTVLAKREVFEEFRYRDSYELSEDYDLFARSAARFQLANLPQVLLHYRRHATQATQARRSKMETIACRIRLEALRAAGLNPSAEEQRIHNMIRAPKSIHSEADLQAIEAWLLQLLEVFEHPEAQRVIASQWIRAAVRAAPLGNVMWRRYRHSRLRDALARSAGRDVDLAILAAMRIDYDSRTFETLRRFGISA